MSCFCAGGQLHRAGGRACLLLWCRLGENWEGCPIPWVIWQVWCRMNQHFMWQWKARSSLVFGRLLWVSSLGMEPLARDITRYQWAHTLSPHTPWHHTRVRHSCEGVLCSSPKRFPRNVWVLGMSFMLPYLHLKQCSLRMWRIASTPGVCSLKEHFSTYRVDRQVGFGNNP